MTATHQTKPWHSLYARANGVKTHFITTRENMRAVIDGLICDKSGITDELIDERLKLATTPGAAEAQPSGNKFPQRLITEANLRQQYSLKNRFPELTIPAIMIWG